MDESMDGNAAIAVEAGQPSRGLHLAPSTPATERQGLTPETLERLVYLVGSPRSGTTVITRSFYLSERVFALPNPTRFTHRVWRHRKKVDRRLLTEIFKMPKFYHERRALRTLSAIECIRVERRIRDAFDSQHLAQMYQLYPLMHSLDPIRERRAESAVCWADKGNDTYGLFEIARALPQSKFIFIIRDPRATVASMKSQTVRSQEAQGSSQANIIALVESCIYWRNMMQNFLRLARRHPDRVMFLRYEEFVEYPEETINRALQFAVNERMPVETLRVAMSKFPHKTKHERKLGGDATGFGIDRQPLDRWRRMLDADEIAFTTALTWRTGRKLGYRMEASSRRFASLEALLRIKNWRSRAVSGAKLAFLELAEWLTLPHGKIAPRSSLGAGEGAR